MRKKTRLLIFTSVLIMMIGAIFLIWKPELIFGQRMSEIPSNRKPACSIFCGDSTMNYVVLGQPPACFGGPLPAGGASDYYKNLSNEDQNALCQNLKSSGGKGSSCPAFKDLMAACKGRGDGSREEPPAETECEKPTPWFDRSTTCTDVRSPVIAKSAGGVTLSMCGIQIFRWVPPDKDPLLVDAYSNALRSWVQSRVGDKVCCSSMLNASRTGMPCNPAADIDCDGKPNQSDVETTSNRFEAVLPDINLSTSPNGADIDQFPPGLDPNDPNFRPERTARNSKGVGECPCKWELVKGDLKCGRRLRSHIYTATWRCPSTKAEVFTTKRFPGNTPCK